MYLNGSYNDQDFDQSLIPPAPIIIIIQSKLIRIITIFRL